MDRVSSAMKEDVSEKAVKASRGSQRNMFARISGDSRSSQFLGQDDTSVIGAGGKCNYMKFK